MMEKIYYNGKIYRSAGQFASALWVRDGKIYRVGGAELAAQARDAGIAAEDLRGAAVVPGFNDSHLHLLDAGRLLNQIDLFGVRSEEELARRCAEFIAARQIPAGRTVLGLGWNQDLFDRPVLPTRVALDAAVPDHPLRLDRVCGHIVVCNTAALNAAGIAPDTPAPAGGSIDWERGILGDNAIALLDPILPRETVEDVMAAYQASLPAAAAKGITTAQSCDPRPGDWRTVLQAVRRLDEAGELPVRLHLQCALDTPAGLEEFLGQYRPGQGGRYWEIGPLKLFVDGSLGSRTALLRQGYADAPGTRGLQCMTPEQTRAMVELAGANGMQVIGHAIGDGAIAQLLDAFGEGANPLRHGVVHCQITTPDLWQRFARGNILAFVQPIFLDYDHTIAADRCGAALAGTSYAFGTAVRLGVPVSYGTDAPVESFDPFPNLYTAVTRRPLDGSAPWYPEECVSRETALDCYTLGGAYAEGREKSKGRLEPGFAADFAVLDRDYFTVPEEEIPRIQVTCTVMDGREVYRADNNEPEEI